MRAHYTYDPDPAAPPVIRPRKIYEKVVWVAFWAVAAAAAAAGSGLLLWLYNQADKIQRSL